MSKKFLYSLSEEDKDFAFKLTVNLLESSKIKDKMKENSKYVIQNIYNLNVGSYILREGTLIGHGQSWGETVDKNRSTWYHPICYHPKLENMKELKYPYNTHVKNVGYFTNNVFFLGGVYFIGHPLKPLKLLPFSNDPICMNWNNPSSKCYLSVNPQPDKRSTILNEKKIAKYVFSSIYTSDNHPSCGFYTPLDCVKNAEKMYPQYDGMTNGCEIVIFSRAMKYISYDLTSDQKKEIKKVTGYDWEKNPMCHDSSIDDGNNFALKPC